MSKDCFTLVIKGSSADARRALRDRHLSLVDMWHVGSDECVCVVTGSKQMIYSWSEETIGKWPGDLLHMQRGGPD